MPLALLFQKTFATVSWHRMLSCTSPVTNTGWFAVLGVLSLLWEGEDNRGSEAAHLSSLRC